MKFHAPFVVLALAASLSAAEVPKIFAGLLQQDVPVKGQIGVVVPPSEIDKYIDKVQKAAKTDPKWFKEFSSAAKPGTPLPYDERLGLTKAEYDEYLALWNKREFKPIAEVLLLLRQGPGDTWSITSTGEASAFSTMRYMPKEDIFRSPNGDMKRLEDIKADASSILGEWTGMEWKFEEETGLGKTKENFALGKLAGDKFGLIVYRAQELSSEGTRLLDKSLVVRFPLGKTAAAPAAATDKEKEKDTKPPVAKTPAKPAKPAPKPAPKK